MSDVDQLRSQIKLLERRIIALETLYNELLTRLGGTGGGTS